MTKAKPKACGTLAPMVKHKTSTVCAVSKTTSNPSLYSPPISLLAPSLPTLLSVDATAVQLSVSTKTVRRLIASGALPFCRVGRLVRIRAVDLETFVASGTEG
jgi:excisionase family DNA binding protein